MIRALFFSSFAVLSCALLSSCTSKPAADAKPADTVALPSPTKPALVVPTYEELLGPNLALKVEKGGPWSLDDIAPLREALIKLKKLNDELETSTDSALKAAAKQRHAELASTYTSLRHLQMAAQQAATPVVGATPQPDTTTPSK